MSLTFVPSLKHAAAVKVALMAYDEDIGHYIKEWHFRERNEIKIYNPATHTFDYLRKETNADDCFQKEYEKWRKNCKENTKNKLSPLLPKSLQDLVTHMFEPIIDEVLFWIQDHFHTYKHIEKNLFWNSLCWKLEGTIDGTQTVKRLIGNESINKRVRFALACIYFLEHDILDLWRSMDAAERQSINDIDSNIAVQFWCEWLKRNGRSSWTQYLAEYMIPNLEQRLNDKGSSCIRLSSFFLQLKELKGAFFYRLWPMHIHDDDLRLCFNLSNDTEREAIFHSQSRTGNLLCRCLDWPLQSLFMDAVKQMKRHLMSYNFEKLLYRIVCRKLMQGVKDFDYLQLLKDLWNVIPDADKEEIEMKNRISLINAALNYDEKTNPRSIEEVLKECNAIENPYLPHFL